MDITNLDGGRTWRDVPSRFQCTAVCFGLLEDPVQLPCRCKLILCRRHLDAMIGTTNRCPHCRQEKMGNKIRRKDIGVEHLWREIQESYSTCDYERDDFEFAKDEGTVDPHRVESNGHVREEYAAFMEKREREIAEAAERNRSSVEELAKKDPEIAADIEAARKSKEDEQKTLALIQSLLAEEEFSGNKKKRKAESRTTMPLDNDSDGDDDDDVPLCYLKRAKVNASPPSLGIEKAGTSTDLSRVYSPDIIAQQRDIEAALKRDLETERVDADFALRLSNEMNRTGTHRKDNPCTSPRETPQSSRKDDFIDLSGTIETEKSDADGGANWKASKTRISNSSAQVPISLIVSNGRISKKWKCAICTTNNSKKWLKCSVCGERKR